MDLKEKKLSQTIGLAKKAGAVVSGTDLVIEKVRAGFVFAVYAASDISEATKKKLSDKTAFYKVPLRVLPLDMGALSACTGLIRPTAAIGLTNKNFIKMIGDIAGKDDNILE